ncbi:MAG TPA: prepilin-type N-terminal cleavage/methylation domain-containing protein [Opitutaceae bacterium]|nr:prepilin-type N-terminal cleavage/methylation domain-containing protein [Opitutaceae bacterium]
MHHSVSTPNRAPAFTLVELLVAMTIIGFAVAGAIAITIQGLKIYYTDTNRLSVNKDMRKFTQAMFTDAAFSNDFYIYDPATNGAIPTSGNDNYVSSGKSGDDLLLVTTSTNSATGAITVTKLIAYYRTVTNTTNNSGPIYRIEVDSPQDGSGTTPAPGNTAIYALWNANIKPLIAGHTATFITSAIGTASYNTSPASSPSHLNVFYNANAFIMVRCQIQEQGYNGGTTANTNQIKAIDTYNLSIWPRG